MDIILLERIEKLGGLGEIVQVKNGYARNYLLPQKKALRATEANKQRFEQERESLEKLNDERRTGAESDADAVAGRDFLLIRQASDTLQLYGSVTAKDIADAIIATGVDIKRQQVRLDRPIKTLGIFEVHVAIHPEVIVTVRANVARSEEEAKIQAEGGSVLPAHEQEALDEQAEAEAEAEAAAAAAAKAAEAVFEAPEKELQAMADSQGADSEGANSQGADSGGTDSGEASDSEDAAPDARGEESTDGTVAAAAEEADKANS